MPGGRKNLWRVPAVLLMAWCLLATAVPAAVARNGTGPGPGIPGKKPLYFGSITLVGGGKVQGADDIPLTPHFELHFDKNVVDALVWARNSHCFTLVGPNNRNVPITVTKIDDTIDVSQKQNIFVQPVSPLGQDTSYTLKVSPDLLAKNMFSTLGGGTAGQGVTIPFKTRTVSAGGSQPAAPQTTQPVKQTVQAAKSGAAAASGQPSAPGQETSAAKGTGPKLSPGDWGTMGVVVLILGWIGVEVLIKRRKRGF